MMDFSKAYNRADFVNYRVSGFSWLVSFLLSV